MKKKPLSVCIKCGGTKESPNLKCPRCQFEPVSLEDKAKSLILSEHIFELPISMELEFANGVPRSSNELVEIANELKEGKRFAFNQELVERTKDFVSRGIEFRQSLQWAKVVSYCFITLIILASVIFLFKVILSS